MSLAQTFTAIGQSASSFVEEADCVDLASGKPFRAKIEPIGDKQLNSLNGFDPRSDAFFHVADKGFSPNMAGIISALGSKWMLIPGNAPNNPASLHNKFQAICGVKGKDSWA